MSNFAGGFGQGIAGGASAVGKAYQQYKTLKPAVPVVPPLNTDGTHNYLGMDQGDVNTGYVSSDGVG
jgi:hypothetical protein